jgi:hypothetical protein
MLNEIVLVRKAEPGARGAERPRTRDSSGTEGKNGWPGADPVPTRKVGTGEGMAHNEQLMIKFTLLNWYTCEKQFTFAPCKDSTFRSIPCLRVY